jgi:hypothetical protein
LVFPKCGSEMKVVAVIIDQSEVNTILECLKRNNAPPFEKVVKSLLILIYKTSDKGLKFIYAFLL